MEEIAGFWAGAIRFSDRVPIHTILGKSGGLASLLQDTENALREAGLPKNMAKTWAMMPPLRTRGEAIPYTDPRYPESLKCTVCPPPVLFVEGTTDALLRPCVAVVGTRLCTPYGASVTYQLASGLSATGICVVSGLARGIDTHAHWATLGRGPTIAVLGHGLDVTAPRSNQWLRDGILSSGGLVMTTYPDEVPPRPHRFPERNRWIASLSLGVVVVEAPARSGALSTARMAAELGRDVFVIPGRLGAPQSLGCLTLISEGAGCISDLPDFVERLSGLKVAGPPKSFRGLTEGATVDAIARDRGVSPTVVLSELGRLEERGLVRRVSNQRYFPCMNQVFDERDNQESTGS